MTALTGAELSSQASAALPARIRDYEIWGRLGEGGMSDVWLAKHALLAIPLVLKTIKVVDEGELQQGARRWPRVIAEARLMARISSPRVVRAIDAGVHEGTPYLVEEYIDGIDLAELDDSRRSTLGVGLPLWFVAQCMHETCEAIHSAHQAGVIHRDIKPSNLFGSLDQGIRLGDFGIAVCGDESDRARAGTLHFMAPEQLEHGESSRRSDLWGAGATACDLRYGSPPFASVADLIAADVPPSMPLAMTSAEAYFQQLLRSMLARDPAARPGDASEAAWQFGLLADALAPAPVQSFAWLDRNSFRVGECSVVLRVGDLADCAADAIVSSAPYEMSMRTGSADALRRRGGDSIEDAALAGGERSLGSCVVTTAGRLEAKHVIHAVSAWNETSCIGRATQRALLKGDELGARSLAMPALGTGAARVTIETCANAMMNALQRHDRLGGSRLGHVEIFFDSDDKMRTFREVAVEVVRGRGARRAALDRGLAVESTGVRGDGVTFLDSKSTERAT